MNKYIRGSIIGLILSTLVACTSLNPIKAISNVMKPSDGVSVDAQVGKENTKQVVGSQTSNEVGGNQQNIKSTNIPPFVLILLVLGWVLPTPETIWGNLKEYVKIKRKK